MEEMFCGIEGGASNSKLVILDSKGQIVSRDDSGPATNHWLIGQKECFERIKAMIENALKDHVTTSSPPLTSLGLCLSGCEDHVTNEQMARAFLAHAPHLTRTCFVTSDTFGALVTCSASEGVVLIAGTGSNCLYVRNGNGNDVKCGGWGHVIGDQGSAFWVSRAALKALVESEERYSTTWSEKEVARVKHVVLEHFGAKESLDLLEPLYRTFNKSHVAAVTCKLAKLAIEEADPVARDLFRRAGVHLGRHVRAVVMKAQPKSRDLTVVCVGSLFKSFEVMKNGFLNVLEDLREDYPLRITLRRLKTSAAVGAAIAGAREAGIDLEVDLKGNSEILLEIDLKGESKQ